MPAVFPVVSFHGAVWALRAGIVKIRSITFSLITPAHVKQTTVTLVSFLFTCIAEAEVKNFFTGKKRKISDRR